MSYYTRYTVEVLEGDISLIAALREFSEDAEDAVDTDGGSYHDSSWFDCLEELKAFSELHPEALFELRCMGTLDNWNAYFKNGKMQYGEATITYDEYDVEKLK